MRPRRAAATLPYLSVRYGRHLSSRIPHAQSPGIVHSRSLFGWSSRSVPATTGKDDPASFLPELLAQDPRGRIRVLPPLIDANSFFGDHVYHYNLKHSRDPATVETHCVPFWTVIQATTHQVGRRRKGRDVWNHIQYRDFGYSVAAVDRDHWCHGVVLTDDVRRLQSSLATRRRVDVGFSPWPESTFGALPQDGDPTLGGFSFGGHRVSRENAVRFATGYPILSQADVVDALKRQMKAGNSVSPADKDFIDEWAQREMLRICGPFVTRAIPSYRIVFKVTHKDRVLLWDGFHTEDCNLEALPRTAQFDITAGPPRVPPAEALMYTIIGERFGGSPPPDCWPFRQFSTAAGTAVERNTRRATLKLAGFHDESPDDEDTYIVATGPENHLIYARAIVAAAQSAELDWDDPAILAAFKDDPASDVNPLLSLVLAATSRNVEGRDMPFPRSFVPPRVTEEPIEPLLLKKPARLKTTRPAPASSGTGASPSESLPRPRPRTLLGSTAGAAGRAKLPPRQVPRAPKPHAMTPAVAAKPPPAVLDNMRYYQTLQMSLSPALLDNVRAQHADAQIKTKHRMLSIMWHPDRADTPEDTAARSEKMKQINVAYAEVQSYDLRQKYQHSQMR